MIIMAVALIAPKYKGETVILAIAVTIVHIFL